MRDAIFQGEPISHGLLESVCPQLVSCDRADQADIDAYSPFRLLHTPFHDAVHVQRAADFLGGLARLPEWHDGSVRDHPQ